MNQSSGTRIVIWLDPSTPQEGLLQSLGGLGSANEILGLFIEDPGLLELSGLSVVREFAVDAATTRPLKQDNLERQFRAHRSRMQKLFEQAARNISSSCSFRIARGEPGAELLKVATTCDMLVVAHSRYQLAPRLTLRARLDELLSAGPPNLMFVQDQWQTGRCVAVLFDGSTAGEAALRTAASLALNEGLSLSVWMPATATLSYDELQTQCAQLLGESIQAEVHTLPDHDSKSLARAAADSNARVLVIPAAEAADTRTLVPELLQRIDCSLIVVR